VYVFFGDHLIHIHCNDQQAGHELGLLFHAWPSTSKEKPLPPRTGRTSSMLTLDIQAHDKLENLPEELRLVFSDPRSLISVLQGHQSWYVCFGQHAVAQIPNLQYGAVGDPITVQVTRASLSAARLEDIVFGSLAPALRRRGIYMIHAFAAQKDDHTLLLVGVSGSGKTTTGLSLVAQGWRYLANDVVLVKQEKGSVIAMPTPGAIGLDTKSFELLPDLTPPPGKSDLAMKYYYPATTFVEGWGAEAPVSCILFPEIATEGETALHPLPSSMTLARLMEASVDRWDSFGLDHHMRLLGQLSRQVASFDLRLGRQLDRLPTMLGKVL
jgi:hypothetical protein